MNQGQARRAPSKAVLRSVEDRGVAAAVRECMDACQWEQVVPRGATVVVKPNLCTAVPEKVEMSNTDPAIARAVCEVLLERAGRVCLCESDNLRQKAQDAFQVSGYTEWAARLGVPLVNLSEAPTVTHRFHGAGDVEVPRLLLEADAFITLPVLKTHALTYFTGSLKNQWGCVPRYDRIVLHQHLDAMLVRLHEVFHPRLAIMDAIVGMEGRGPVSGKPHRLNLVLASRDSVALDCAAARLVGLDPSRARHLVMAAERGLGHLAKEHIELDGDWAGHATQFEPAVLDGAIAAMNYMSRYRWFVRYALEKDTIFYPVRSLVQVLRRVRLVEGGS